MMKFFRASLAATYFALAFGAPTTVDAVSVTTLAPTIAESPLQAAESALEQAKQHANETLQVVIHDERAHDEVDDSQDMINQEVDQIEAAQPNTTSRWAKERKRKLKEREHAKMRSVRNHTKVAKEASKAYKRAARLLERQRQSSGELEFVYGRDLERDQEQADAWRDEAENYGDAAKSHVEAFYDLVQNELERRIERAEHTAEHVAEQQREEQQGNREHRDWAADEDEDEGEHEDSVVIADDGLVTVAVPLNLRGAGPSAANNGQGFLLTVALVGSLLSMAFAVRMGGRPTIQQARVPLLGA